MATPRNLTPLRALHLLREIEKTKYRYASDPYLLNLIADELAAHVHFAITGAGRRRKRSRK